VGFTLPSAVILILLALWLPALNHPIADAAIHGLKLVALIVVAQAVWQMSKTLTPDLSRRLIASAVFIGLLFIPHPLAQLGAIALSGIAGLLLCSRTSNLTAFHLSLGYSTRTAWVIFSLFALLLIGLPLFAHTSSLMNVLDGFYRAGALVFGGGHVVLPLLENTVVLPGWVSADDYLEGYGAAQAMPGPVFSVAAYLGVLTPVEQGPIVGALVALVGIFLPGLLLVSAALPLWHRFILYPAARSVVAGINAGVVGLLALALYDPIWTSSVQSVTDFVIGLIGFIMLIRYKITALYIVIYCLMTSILMSLF
jgi:chromate transporter